MSRFSASMNVSSSERLQAGRVGARQSSGRSDARIDALLSEKRRGEGGVIGWPLAPSTRLRYRACSPRSQPIARGERARGHPGWLFPGAGRKRRPRSRAATAVPSWASVPPVAKARTTRRPVVRPSCRASRVMSTFARKFRKSWVILSVVLGTDPEELPRRDLAAPQAAKRP